MSLYEQWKETAEKERKAQESELFWAGYFEKEKSNYERILENKQEEITGTVKELADDFEMDTVTFIGFLDGINTSLEEQIELEGLNEDSQISLKINFEKLYYNMLGAKADWLYNLPQWDGLLDEEKRKSIKREYNSTQIAVSNKVGRNDSCPCGSGLKYKKCCGK